MIRICSKGIFVSRDTPEGLQTSLNNLETHCSKWNIHVNVGKTKTMIFRKGGQLRQSERFTYAGL